jgi:hypothetical protein
VVLALANSVTSLVALSSAHAAERYVRAAFWVSIATVAMAAVGALSEAHLWLVLSSAIQVLLLAAAMTAVLRRVASDAGADSRTILGAISVYTVLGLLFTFIYVFVARVQDTPFFEGHPRQTGSDFIFFSYTTLTTTGFGDLVPAGQPGRMLAGLEMLIGQIFLVTLVAGLVSLWRPGERIRRRRAAGEAARSIVCGSTGLSRPSVWVDSIASTASIPSTTSPNTVCLPSSQGAALTVTTKNCEPLVLGPALAIASAPRTTLWSLNSSSKVYPGPPVPVPSGQPPWIMKSGITRWKMRSS